MGLLDGKVAVITGAARGIGKAIALKYASEGADIAFTDLVINEAAEATAKEIEAYGVKVKARMILYGMRQKRTRTDLFPIHLI